MTNSFLITTPETQTLRAAGSSIQHSAEGLAIRDDEALELAGELLMQVRDARKTIEEKFRPSINAAHKAHREMLALFKEVDAPYESAERTIKNRAAIYTAEVKRRAEQAQREAEAVAHKAAEEERIKRAEELAAQNRHAEAEAELDAPLDVPAVAPVVTVPKVAGFGTRDRYTARVDRLALLVQYVAANPEYTNLLQPNQSALNDLAASRKQAGPMMAGVTCVRETIGVGR